MAVRVHLLQSLTADTAWELDLGLGLGLELHRWCHDCRRTNIC